MSAVEKSGTGASRRVSEDISKQLNRRLSNRLDRQQLIDRFILRGVEDDNPFQKRGQTLRSLLERRPSRDRLMRLNVIKEESSSTSDALVATKQKLQKEQKKSKLSALLQNRPKLEELSSRRIIVDEREAFRLSNTKSMMKDFLKNRPQREALLEQKIFEAEESTLPKPQSSSSPSSGWRMVPKHVTGLDDIKVVEVQNGWSHTVFLDEKGYLYAFGSSSNGRLGNGESAGIGGLSRVENLANVGPVSTFSVGDNHNAAVVGGKLYTWGDGSWGRLGLKDAKDRCTPTLVEALDEDVMSASAGGYHTLVLTQSGKVKSFGWNKGGRLGLGEASKSIRISEEPVDVTALEESAVVRVEAGSVSSAVVTAEGKVFTWGSGHYGILGHGSEDNQWEPKQVEAIDSEFVTLCSVGEYHMLVATKSGKVYSWGRNDYSQLGRDPKDNDNFVPNIVVNLVPGKTTVLSCGKQHTAAISSGKLYTWGKGTSGVLGHGNSSSQDTAKCVEVLEGPVVSVSAAWSHTSTCTSDGALYTFGSKSNGQLGKSSEDEE